MTRMRSLMFAVFFVAACGIGTAARAEPISGGDASAYSDVAPQAREIQDAVAKFKARDYDGALRQFKGIAKNDADFPPVGVVMAQLYHQEGMAKQSKAALETATRESPDDPEAFLLLAGIALQAGDAAEAERLYKQAGSLMTGFNKSAKRKQLLQPQVYAGLATTARARKDWPAAQKAVEAWLQFDPRNPAAKSQLAYCLFQQKDVEGALKQLRELAMANAEALAPEAILAQWHQQAGDRANAKKWLVAALAAAPKDHRIHLAAGQAALEAGDVDVATKHAIAAVRITPKSADAQFFRGVAALFQKDFVTAESYLEMAAKQSPDNFGVANNLVLALIELDEEAKRDRALQLAEANWKKYPKLAEANATYAWALYRAGKLDDAEKKLQAASTLERDNNGDLAYYMAKLAVDRGHKAEARKLLETAMESKKPFLYRPEAEELLGQLKK